MLEGDIKLMIMTPSGPVFLHFPIDQFTELVQMLSSIVDQIKKETSIPKVFEDAFKEEE